jgi:hypothetical protein
LERLGAWPSLYIRRLRGEDLSGHCEQLVMALEGPATKPIIGEREKKRDSTSATGFGHWS